MYAGFPVTSEKRDGRVYYHFVDGFQIGDAPFTADEILSLAFGADLLRTLEGTVFHDSIRSALHKIQASLGPEMSEFLARLGESFQVLPGPHKEYAARRDTIHALNEALLARRTVEMRYRTGRTGRVAARALDPYRLWYRNGGLYVIGHDHKSDEVRTFAVDRIEALETSGGRFSIPESFDFDAYTAGSFGVVAEPETTVRIRFLKRRALYVEEHTWHPSQQIARDRDGSIVLTMQVGASSELRDWVLSFGGDAEVLEPESLQREVCHELDRARARYAETR
jgi:predicted DNA-binding transcriptional regulator YafY